MNIQEVLVGSWFQHPDNGNYYKVEQVNSQTIQLARPSGAFRESVHIVFAYLKGIIIQPHMLYMIGFVNHDLNEDDYAYNIIKGKMIKNPETELEEPVIFPTNLHIKCTGDDGRFTIYLQHKESKIYLPEISYIHELQQLIFTLTLKFPHINL